MDHDMDVRLGGANFLNLLDRKLSMYRTKSLPKNHFSSLVLFWSDRPERLHGIINWQGLQGYPHPIGATPP